MKRVVPSASKWFMELFVPQEHGASDARRYPSNALGKVWGSLRFPVPNKVIVVTGSSGPWRRGHTQTGRIGDRNRYAILTNLCI